MTMLEIEEMLSRIEHYAKNGDTGEAHCAEDDLLEQFVLFVASAPVLSRHNLSLMAKAVCTARKIGYERGYTLIM